MRIAGFESTLGKWVAPAGSQGWVVASRHTDTTVELLDASGRRQVVPVRSWLHRYDVLRESGATKVSD